jgi:hypothetical protein
VIGGDGTCKVCGRAAPNWGDERKRGLLEEPEDADEDAGPGTKEATAAIEADGEWSGRALCPDGGCVGVIGDDGTCKVCGRAAEESDEDSDDEGDGDEDGHEGDEDDHDGDEDDHDGDEDDHDGDEVDGHGDEGEGDAGDESDDEEDSDAASARASANASAGDGDDDRRLCPDGGCVGLIGADGKCKICGRSAA